MPRLRVRHAVDELNASDHQGIGCHAVNLRVMQRWQYRFAGAGFEDFGDAGRAVEW